MRSVRAIIVALALAAGMTSAKNAYKGCGFGGEDDAGEPKVKDCLGWAEGQDENDCMKPEACSLVLGYRTSADGDKAYIEMYHTHPDAAEGWIAVGFSEDRKMGNDAVLMDVTQGIYASKYDPGDLLTRWNVETADGKASLETEDIGALSNMTERHGINDTENPFVYAIVEVPLQFTIKEPIEGGRMVDVDLTKGYYLMMAAGDMDESGEQPQKHRDGARAASQNMITIGSGNDETTTIGSGNGATSAIVQPLVMASVLLLASIF